MRPYFALIKDSFRAAVASRVLYILLLLIVLLLVALAPLHMRETLDTKLIFMENVKQPEKIAAKLVEKHDSDRNKPVARIWELLPEELTDQLSEFHNLPDKDEDNEEEQEAEESEDQERAPRGRGSANVEEMLVNQELIEALNELIEDPSLYRAEDWEDTSLNEEAKELIATGPENLSEDRAKRLNRLLVARAFSPAIESGDTALDFYYAIWKWDIFTTSATHQQFAQTLTSQLSFYFDKYIISIGLFIAILVTANIIPDTFEPGSLNLLLSKPVSRWCLYLAKFAGGCVFVFMCACVLFLGLWLWLGFAMGVWERSILYSIPLYVFVFAIYFSVSAFVGLVWRSPIMSIVITLLFWVLCFAVGSSHGVFANKMANNEFIDLLPVKDNLYAVDLLHQLKRKDDKGKDWDMELEAELTEEASIQMGVNSWVIPLRNLQEAVPGLENRIPPAYDPNSNLIVASPFEFGQISSSGKKLSVSFGDKPQFQNIGYFPRNTLRLFSSDKGIIAATSDGRFHRFNAATAKSALEQYDAKDEDKNLLKADDLFEKIGPRKRVSIREPELVDFNPANNKFAIYRNAKLTLFDLQEDGKYKKGDVITTDNEFSKKMSCLVAYKGDVILLAYGNGRIHLYDANTLEKTNEFIPEARSTIDSIAGSPDGRHFAVKYRNGKLWTLDTQANNFQLANIVGQGKVSTFTFDSEGDLWVSENTDRATEYDLTDGSAGTRFAPGGTWIEKTYRWGLSPLYRVFPKPGEFYKVVTHLSSSGDAESNLEIDLRERPLENSEPWLPLWSGLGFMGMMLFLACLVFHFKDY